MVSGKLALANSVAAGALALSFCACAGAADLTRRPPPPPLMPVPMWNGLYVGGHIGGVTTSETATDIFGFSASPDPSGFLGGAQVGYNYQVAPNWLIGIEGEFSGTSASGTSVGFQSDHRWYSTLDARWGYVMGSWLLYAKGGGAWMNADYSVPGESVNVTRGGWNIGAGAEFMLAPQWSAKAEYTFLDFGNDTVGFPFTGPVAVDTRVHEFKFGVNYHFAPGAVFGRW
jgi:opacity protein-like surface antigen